MRAIQQVNNKGTLMKERVDNIGNELNLYLSE